MIKEKQIDPFSLITLVKESLSNKITDHYESGPLPKNCIYYGVVERNSQKPEQVIIIEREACIRPYNHLGTILQVGYPKLLFCYRVVSENVQTFYVAAAVDEIIKNSSEIYLFPYANVYLGGNVCMGSFVYPLLRELAELTYYPEAFYTIEHTHLTNAKNQLIADLLEKNENKAFDSKLLIPDCNFEKFVKGISGIQK